MPVGCGLTAGMEESSPYGSPVCGVGLRTENPGRQSWALTAARGGQRRS